MVYLMALTFKTCCVLLMVMINKCQPHPHSATVARVLLGSFGGLDSLAAPGTQLRREMRQRTHTHLFSL